MNTSSSRVLRIGRMKAFIQHRQQAMPTQNALDELKQGTLFVDSTGKAERAIRQE